MACAYLTWDGLVGLIGGVCTRPSHRRQGLSRDLTARLVTHADELYSNGNGPRWIVLGTTSPIASRIFLSAGFVGLRGSLDTATKGAGPKGEAEEWILVRDFAEVSRSRADGEQESKSSGTENVAFAADAYVHGIAAADVAIEPLAQRHLAGTMLLLNLRDGFMKMRSFGIANVCTTLRLTQVPNQKRK